MTVHVSLTGGLGNQMFQLAAGLYFCRSEEFFLIKSLGNPRSHSNIHPDIADWILPPNSILSSRKKASLFERKVAGYLLNKGTTSPPPYPLNWPTRLERLAGILLTLQSGTTQPVLGNFGTGLDARLMHANPSILIGYFQSAEFLSDSFVHQALLNLRPKLSHPETTNLTEKATLIAPRIIHIRRGDYVGSGLGTLGEKYFGTALERLSTNSSGKETWVFSNDIPEARELLKKQNLTHFRFIEESQRITPVNTMHLMRHGSSFIISNSSFSWWAAALALDQNAPVIAPAPWFKSLESPQGIHPKNWITTPSEFE